MKSILMTTSAVLLVTGFAVGQAQAACPEDIDTFNREYEQTLQTAAAGEALSTTEQAQLFGLRTAAENLHQAGNAEMCAAVIQRAQLILDSAIAPQVIRPDELVGREVVNTQDEDLGEIEEVMIDPVSGRIAYVIIEHGGFLGIGDDLFAVPWGAMRFVPGNDQTLLLDVPEEKLENAPRFSRDDESPLERREWVTSVHTYYGVEPYWQDDVGAMAMQYGGGAAADAAAGGQPQADQASVQGEGGAGAQTGAEPAGEVTTIVVPITEPETQEEPQEQSDAPSKPEEDAGADSQSATEPQTNSQAASQSQTGSQSPAEPRTGTANLAGTQPPAEDAGAGSEEVSMLVSRIDQLEQQVQQLSQQMPGEEIRQQISQLQDQVAALADSDATGAQDAGGAGQSGQPAAVVVVPSQETQPAQQQESQTRTGAQREEQQPAAQQPGEQQPAQQQTAQQQPAQQQTGEPAEPGTATQQGEEEQEAQGATESRSAAATPVAAAAGGEGSAQPCEEQLAQLEEDLRRAEELGINVEDAQSEFKEAQAMLNNNSEALCRAAIKRAHDELTAMGFEVQQGN